MYSNEIRCSVLIIMKEKTRQLIIRFVLIQPPDWKKNPSKRNLSILDHIKLTIIIVIRYIVTLLLVVELKKKFSFLPLFWFPDTYFIHLRSTPIHVWNSFSSFLREYDFSPYNRSREQCTETVQYNTRYTACVGTTCRVVSAPMG